MCDIPQVAAMGHSTFWPLDSLRNQLINLELLEDTNMDALYMTGIQNVSNELRQCPPIGVRQFWQPEESSHLLSALVKDLVYDSLKYQKTGNVKDQFDNPFTSIQW